MGNEAGVCGYCFLSQLRDGRCGACGKAAPVAATAALPVGSWLADGRYCVGYPLGDPGGFGIAYRCWEYDLRRMVVVKELFPGDLVTRYPGSTQVQTLNENTGRHFALQRELFIEEARRLAQLEEVEAVVRVLSYFQENGTAYFVMPFVEGEPLSGRINPKQRMSAVQALSLLWPLMLGVAGVHRQGMLHCDIKPENVLIKKNGDPVLIDFGNAVSLAALADGRKGGFHAFSPNFSPPEQQSNDKSRMGLWTDVYAICALLYYVVSGQRPVDARERGGSDDLTPLRQLVPDSEAVPDIFVATVEHGLRLNKEERLSSVDALIDALAPLAPGAAVHWAEALPINAFGQRMRRVNGAVETGRALPVQWNWRAGLFQWFWFFAHRLPAPATGLAAIVLLAAAIGLVVQAFPIFLMIGLLISGALGAAFADALLYRRIATLGSGLRGDSAQARQVLARAGQPHPSSMLLGLAVPLFMLGFGVLRQGYEEAVQEQVERAIALPAVRERYAEYWALHGAVPLSLEELDYQFMPDSEVGELSLVGGNLHAVMAIPAVSGRKFILRPAPGRGGNIDWRCEAIGVPAIYIPSACTQQAQ